MCSGYWAVSAVIWPAQSSDRDGAKDTYIYGISGTGDLVIMNALL
jgi:hypothetical protein